MKRKTQKIVLYIEKSEIDSLVGNAGEFEGCDGLMSVFFKLNTNYLDVHKFSLTNHGYKCMYKGVLSALNGNRYPTKSGNEYSALVRVKKLMEFEYKRQTNNELSL